LVKESYVSEQQPRQKQDKVAFANPAFATQFCVGPMFLKPWAAVFQTACQMQQPETWTLPRSQTPS